MRSEEDIVKLNHRIWHMAGRVLLAVVLVIVLCKAGFSAWVYMITPKKGITIENQILTKAWGMKYVKIPDGVKVNREEVFKNCGEVEIIFE